MKIGDLVRYDGVCDITANSIAMILYVNQEGETLKVFSKGKIKWFVTSYCEVVSESR